jgi:hypothetical protein
MPPGTPERIPPQRGWEHDGMGLLWGILKAVTLTFGVIIAVLLIIDSTLFANLLRKGET